MQDIDIVVLWVDGTDKNWQEEKHLYSSFDEVSRYRDWGLMKYWFRGIEKYAPWVRKVHFVTWGHLPEFLNTENKKLHIVNHKDYMPEGTLPTFSSIPLELNLHRIEGLSEQFLLFNDDIFLTRPVSPEDFFRDSKPVMRYLERPIRFKGNMMFNHNVASALDIVNRNAERTVKPKSLTLKDWLYNEAAWRLNHEYFTGFKTEHGINPYLKSTFEEVWGREPELLMEMSAHKFRQPTDANQYVMAFWQLARGMYCPGKRSHLTCDITEESIDDICTAVEKQQYSSVCLNDPDGEVDFDMLSKRLQEAFEKILPEKSKYEI